MHSYINFFCAFYIMVMLISAISVRKALVCRRYVYVYYLISAILLGYFLWVWHQSFGGVWDNHRQYSFGFLLSWLFFMTVIAVFVISEDVVRILSVPFRWRQSKRIPSHRRFVSLLGLGIASIPLAGMLHGIFRGRYNYRVIKHTLFFDDLPDAFDGYKITHISDIHSGSLDNIEKVSYGVELINAQQSDVIFFTGDLVNNKAEEMNNWLEIFSQLKAKDGVFSVLGNHDYGDYVQWNSIEEKQANLQQVKEIHHQLGYKLLLDESFFVEKQGERIAILGVENWGEGFVKKGDLEKALTDVSHSDFKILLSHDPTHWQYQVINYPTQIHMTLSGHTHGMQFGIEIPGWIKWSPSQWRYKYWGGIYTENNRYINVNRGFGYLAFPGRVGMPPEITIIELRKKVV